jgi:hypothetical protein
MLKLRNPQNLLFEGNHLGYEYCILNAWGYNLGYVKVPEDRCLAGISYVFLSFIKVYGGLTYSDKDSNSKDWWFGFDFRRLDPAIIKTPDSVDAECKQLCKQFAFIQSQNELLLPEKLKQISEENVTIEGHIYHPLLNAAILEGLPRDLDISKVCSILFTRGLIVTSDFVLVSSRWDSFNVDIMASAKTVTDCKEFKVIVKLFATFQKEVTEISNFKIRSVYLVSTDL